MLYEMRLAGLAIDPFNNSPIAILKDRHPSQSTFPNMVDDDDDNEIIFEAEESIDLKVDAELEENDDERILPIWIGESEAQAIAMELIGFASPRPLTHDLLKSLIISLGADVQRIIIHNFKDNIFYASIEIILDSGEELSIDSRPSDALALALRFGVGIFVDSSVLKQAKHNKEGKSAIVESEVKDVDEDSWSKLVEKFAGTSFKKYKQ